MNGKDIIDPTTAMNMALSLMAKAFKLNYSTLTNNNQRISSNPRNRQIAQLGMNIGQDRQMQMIGVQNVKNQVAQNPRVQNDGNQNQIGNGHFARDCTVRPRRRDAAYLQTQLLIAQKEEAGIQLQAEEYDLMAAAADPDEIKEVNANCILMANLQQASSLGTQIDCAPVYDSDGSAEKENDIISEVTRVEQSGETVEQHSANFEETCALYESLYQNLAIEVKKVNLVNRKLKETNADLTTELARYKNQERCFEISQEKYDKLERQIAQSADIDEIEEFNANCISMANSQSESTSGTQSDKAPVYDSDGSAEYNELLEPIPEPHQVLQNDSNVTSVVSSVEQGGGTVDNILQMLRKHVVQNAVQNPGVQNVRNQNRVLVVSGIANENVNADIDEIEEFNANCISMANSQSESTSGTQSDKAPVYDSDGSAEYNELLEPIPEPHQVLQNDSNVTSVVSSVEQGGGTVDNILQMLRKHVFYMMHYIII
nr:hypothetical protein [Tanacetum cinerariifolium]